MAEHPESDEDIQAMSEWTPAFTAKLASDGDNEAARELLREFEHGVQLTSDGDWPQQVPRAYAEYIAAAIRKMLDEKVEPAIALGIKSTKPGRRVGAATHDQVKLAAAYWLLVRAGNSPEHAKASLKAVIGTDPRTVERAASACSNFGDRSLFNDAVLVAIIDDAVLLSQLIHD